MRVRLKGVAGSIPLFATLVAAAASFVLALPGCGSPEQASVSNGSLWSVAYRGSPTTPLAAVTFADAHRGWAVGWAGVSVTADGGITWKAQAVPDAVDTLRAICATDSQHVWAMGGEGTPGVLRSVDGGATWSFSRVEGSWWGIAFADARNGWLVGGGRDPAGLDEVIMHTSDGGIHWTEQLAPQKVSLQSVAAVDSGHAWVVGVNSAAGRAAVILATADGGRTWRRQVVAEANGLRSVTFIDRRHGWAVGGAGTVCLTTDGGRHWLVRHVGEIDPLGSRPVLLSVSFPDDRSGWACGATRQAPGKTRAVMMHSGDGGLHWQEQKVGLKGLLECVDFVDATNGWAVGAGAVLRYR